MLRRLANPPNPWETRHREYLDEPPPARLEVYEEHARSLLARNDSPDIGFRWSVNPYRGCQHACAYCYARPTHEYLGLGAGTDFDTRITVKVNAPQLLRQALQRRTWKRERIALSGVTDCYQPLEAVYGLTRRCLEVCYEVANPVSIVTKSYLIVRDLDLLAAMAAACRLRVYVSIPFADDRLARLIEPGAPPPSRRFEALRRLSAAGIPTAVMMAPIIPGLNDREIPAVLARSAECGARSASYLPLRLPGSVRPVFLQRLRAALPLRAAHIEQRIRAMRGGHLNDPRFGARMCGSGPYWESIEALFRTTADRLGLVHASEATRPARPGGCGPPPCGTAARNLPDQRDLPPRRAACGDEAGAGGARRQPGGMPCRSGPRGPIQLALFDPAPARRCAAGPGDEHPHSAARPGD